MPQPNERSENFVEHFALIYIDHEGNLRHQVSASIFDNVQSILSPQVTRAFLKAVAESRASSFLESPDSQSVPSTAPNLPIPRAVEPRAAQRKRRRARIEKQDSNSWAASSSATAQLHATTQLPLSQQDLLRQYYEKVFQNLQQENCRVIAKIYVKLVEPRKQVHYPYNGRKLVEGKKQQFNPEETRPPWWPLGVTHREPDHLPKSGRSRSTRCFPPSWLPLERIALLIHILCELRTSHGITARKLKSAGQPVQHQIAPIERLQLLDELYRVREAEETFLDAMIGKLLYVLYVSTGSANWIQTRMPVSPYQMQTYPKTLPRQSLRTCLRIYLSTSNAPAGKVNTAMRSLVAPQKKT